MYAFVWVLGFQCSYSIALKQFKHDMAGLPKEINADMQFCDEYICHHFPLVQSSNADNLIKKHFKEPGFHPQLVRCIVKVAQY